MHIALTMSSILWPTHAGLRTRCMHMNNPPLVTVECCHVAASSGVRECNAVGLLGAVPAPSPGPFP